MMLIIEVQTMVLGESWFIRLDHWSWNNMKLNVSQLMVIGFHQKLTFDTISWIIEMTLLIEVQTMVLGESWFIRLDHWSWNDMKLKCVSFDGYWISSNNSHLVQYHQ